MNNMTTNKIYCSEHNHVFEFVCTGCKSFLCPECLETHQKHIGKTDSCFMHLLQYAKINIRPHYVNTIKIIQEKGPNLVSEVPEGLQKLKQVLSASISLQNQIKSLNDQLESFNDDLSRVLAKLTFAMNPADEGRNVESEFQELENAIKTANLAVLIKILQNEESALSRPRLIPEDIISLNKLNQLYRENCEKSLQEITNQLNLARKNMESLFNEAKNCGAHLQPDAIKEIKKEEIGAPKNMQQMIIKCENLLKNAIQKCEIDELYHIFTELRKNGISDVMLVKLCLSLDRGMFFLLSYAHQQKLINPNDELMKNIEISYVNTEISKDKVNIPKFQAIQMSEIMGFNQIKDILRENSIRLQEKKYKEFRAKSAKEFFAAAKKTMEEYFGYMEFQSRFAFALVKHKPEWAQVLLKLDSVLKVAFYANQIPSLEPEVGKMSKKIDVLPRHMAIIRLKAYGQSQDWKGFITYILGIFLHGIRFKI